MFKLLVSLAIIGVGLAQLVPIYELNKTIDEYAKELGFNNFELEFRKFKVIFKLFLAKFILNFNLDRLSKTI